MRRSLLPVVLLTTITLSSSNVLPILSINKVDTEPLLDDQDSDNTYFNKHTNVNPNIFYKVFIETPKDKPKKTQVSRSKYIDNDNQDTNILNGKIDNEDNDDEGYRKEQWHNYPRQLDRLNRNFNTDKEFENILLETKDLENLKRIDDAGDDNKQYISDDVERFGADNIDGPLLILKIRLAYLTDNMNNADTNKFIYTDLTPSESTSDNKKENVNEDNMLNDIESLIKVKRKAKPRVQNISFLDSANDKKYVRKRIFSLWSRLQSLSHRGHELHHRRHLYALYGLPEEGGGTLTAETRAMMRPPGSPLRWG